MTRWLIASGDFTPFGGMDQANHALAAYLAQAGREVHLVGHRVAPDLERHPAVRVHRVPRPLDAHLLGAPLLAREASRQVRALGSGCRVLINGGNAQVQAPTWVHYLHGAYAPLSGGSLRTRAAVALGRRYFLKQEAAAIRRAPLILCNSHRTSEDVVRTYGVAAERTRVIYYGAAPDRFSPVTSGVRAAARQALGVSPEGTVAVFIGALGDRRKGFDVLFEAWRALAATKDWNADLLVVGTGREREAWIRRADAAGLGSRMRFLGFRSDVERVIAAADVLVHPARYEPYGLGIHEALCRGIPAIVSRACGIAERYTPELRDLIVSESVDARSLGSALQAWRSQKDAWAARVAPFGATLRSRTWDHMAADVAAAVESM